MSYLAQLTKRKLFFGIWLKSNDVTELHPPQAKKKRNKESVIRMIWLLRPMCSGFFPQLELEQYLRIISAESGSLFFFFIIIWHSLHSFRLQFGNFYFSIFFFVFLFLLLWMQYAICAHRALLCSALWSNLSFPLWLQLVAGFSESFFSSLFFHICLWLKNCMIVF